MVLLVLVRLSLPIFSVLADLMSGKKGVSYVLNGERIGFITEWPSQNTATRNGLLAPFKVPSQVSYLQNLPSRSPWGFLVTPEMQAYTWTKLLLDANLQRDEFGDEVLQKISHLGVMQLPPGKSAMDIIAIFLHRIFEHIVERLETVIGHHGGFRQTPVDLWFTIPASWSRETRDLMHEAIKRAGLTSSPFVRIYTMPEPEAAALSVMQTLAEKFQVSWTSYKSRFPA